MNSQGFERDTMTAVLNSKRVWVVHIVTNALLMIAFFYWTQIPEETGWQFTLTVVCALAIAIATLWLHSATFVYFGEKSGHRLRTALRDSVARIPAFLIWALIFGLVLWLIGRLWEYDEQAGGYARHLLPQFLRRAITPRSMFSVSHWLIGVLYFFVWPILFLPVAAQVAMNNFRGFFSAAVFRPIREVRFWLAYLICLVVGAYVPYRLAWMVPRKPSPLSRQEWSMALRLGVGYMLLVTAWVVLCAAIMRVSAGENKVAREPEPVRAIPTS
jgi:heme/copper-type cytochrome/quinol oxidase subunit 4